MRADVDKVTGRPFLSFFYHGVPWAFGYISAFHRFQL